ncbi:MAG: V-type ATP synthase subunit D [Lentisphaeraceae bacterium]|nr:V-type ATP synthase subunit D [Lentisphaeraceae bacterium]
MAKIKHTKTELKAQTDALKRFQRFLPMLQLKKQQLQAEIAGISAKLAEVEAREAQARKRLEAWVALYADQAVTPETLVLLKGTKTGVGNIAGVAIPLYEGIETEPAVLDPYRTPAWTDDAQAMLAELMAFRAEGDVLRKQRELVQEELHTTGQRVNLFEKVKIPECKENIRVIRIFIGDEQTAAVVRGKIAKGRTGKTKEVAE